MRLTTKDVSYRVNNVFQLKARGFGKVMESMSVQTCLFFGETPVISVTNRTYFHYLACALFVITCAQLTFLSPYPVVVQNERSNVFSGLLCAITFLAAVFSTPKNSIKLRSPEIIVSIILTLLAAASAATSPTPASSGCRAFVIMSSAIGGYWSSRLLLQSVKSRMAFVYLCLALMICTIFLFFLGLFLHNEGYRYFDVGYHAVSSRMILMSFAAIAMIASCQALKRNLAIGVLILGYVTLVALLLRCGVSTAPVVPILLLFLGSFFLWNTPRIRKFVLGALVISIMVVATFSVAIVNDLPKDSQSVAYRVENLFFSSHIAMKHPILGIGPFAPREEFLQDYDVKYPHLNKDKFTRMTREVITSENLPLTLIAEFGLPFTFIYLATIIYFVFFLMKLAKNPPVGFYPHPLALLLPVVGILIEFQIFDAIYHPQIGWFFHVLLGLCFLDRTDAELTPNSQTDVAGNGLATC